MASLPSTHVSSWRLSTPDIGDMSIRTQPLAGKYQSEHGHALHDQRYLGGNLSLFLQVSGMRVLTVAGSSIESDLPRKCRLM